MYGHPVDPADDVCLTPVRERTELMDDPAELTGLLAVGDRRPRDRYGHH